MKSSTIVRIFFGGSVSGRKESSRVMMNLPLFLSPHHEFHISLQVTEDCDKTRFGLSDVFYRILTHSRPEALLRQDAALRGNHAHVASRGAETVRRPYSSSM